MTSPPALMCDAVGKRYGSIWALHDCTLRIPAGSVTALVGPNGAGKTTLLQLAAGMSSPTSGQLETLGWSPRDTPMMVLPRIGFVAQDHPLYRGFSLADMLKFGRKLNPRWDDQLALRRLETLGLKPSQRLGKLSGGQQAQVALTLALAKRPELLLLDEPAAALDPLARREFLQALMEAVVEEGVTVVLSSHILADLERVCRLGDEVNDITTPLLITDPDDKQFFPGQPQQLYDLVPGTKELVRFAAEEGAGGHCEPMARSLRDTRIFDWLEDYLR